MNTFSPASMKRGDTIHLVRWVPTGDGWKPELLSGRYAGRTDSMWLLGDGQTPMSVSRAEWLVCRP